VINLVLKELMVLIVNKNVIVKMMLNVIGFLENVNAQMVGKVIIVIVNVMKINGEVHVNLIVIVLVLVHVINILEDVYVKMVELVKNVKKFVKLVGLEKVVVQNVLLQFVEMVKIVIMLLDFVINAILVKLEHFVNNHVQKIFGVQAVQNHVNVIYLVESVHQ
jgi:hypothetical protein